MVRIAVVALLGLASLSACSWFQTSYLKDNEKIGIPLSVKLEFDTSAADASLEFIDACQQRELLPLGQSLTSIITRQMNLTFEQVHTAAAPTGGAPIDGTVRIELGLKELEMFVTRQGKHTYPATVSLGGTVTYLDAAGTTLFTKKLRTEITGEVDTEAAGCEVKGLPALANETIGKLAQGFKKQLADSVKVRKAAAGRKPGSLPVAMAQASPALPSATGTGSPQGAMASSAGTVPVPVPVPAHTPPPSLAAGPSAVAAGEAQPSPAPVAAEETGPPMLSFRAILRDENGDHVLTGGELITVEIEVTNKAEQIMRGVAATFSGSQVMTEAFPKPVLVGDLNPGESRRIKTSGRLGAVSGPDQGELVVGLTSSTSGVGKIPRKKFIASVRPAEEEEVEILSVDVDRTPRRVRGYEQRKVVSVAIGVGSFRSPDVTGLKYAAHDAEVMARYFQTVGGIPSRRIKVLTDDRAFKEDFTEVFEEWLPQQVEDGGTVVVYFSGRAVADPTTGAISLFPYEGVPGAAAHLFTLRRLHMALARLPVEHAVLILDVTLTEPSDPGPVKRKEPAWSPMPSLLQGGKLVQIVGNTGLQHAHEYPKGKHGLFTYFLLKGLAGEADEDRNGIVAVGELFEYAKHEVMDTAKAEFGNDQEPVCIPGLDPDERNWSIPLARVR
jgi:hypothetical protein